MDIQKTPRARIDNSLLVQQHQRVASPISGVEPLRNSTPRPQENRSADHTQPSRDEVQLALTGLEKSARSNARSAPYQYNTALPNRTRQALDAYLSLQNHPQEEAQSSLRRMLGVDYFV